MLSHRDSIWWDLQQPDEDEAVTSQVDPREAPKQHNTTPEVADYSDAHSNETSSVSQSQSQSPLQNRREDSCQPTQPRTTATSICPPSAASSLPMICAAPSCSTGMQKPSACHPKDDTQKIQLHMEDIEQQATMIQTQSATHVAMNSPPSPMPNQHSYAHVTAMVVSPSSCSGQVNTMDSSSGAGEITSHHEAQAQRACLSAHFGSMSTVVAADAAVFSHAHTSDKHYQAVLLAAAAQNSSEPVAAAVSSSSGHTVSRSRSAGLAAQHPLHSAKAIWLGFVRRAYRKFGKEMLSDVDLRWRTRGASVLAAAWRRTDAAHNKICSQRGPAHAADAAATQDDVMMEPAATVHANSGFLQLNDPTSSSCLADQAAPMIDVHHSVDASRRRVPRSSIRASAEAQMQQALTDMLQAGDEGSSTCNWVLTWPCGMLELNTDQLVLLPRNTALHRSRNRHVSCSTRVAFLKSNSTA